ncbi:MAG: hypothetical protein AB8B64_23295 [Granulosicoccus sp.]
MSMLLAQLQSSIESRYDLDIPYRIEHFVSCDRALADRLADEQADEGQPRPDVDEEVVFIHQHEGSLEFTVYVDEGLLSAVDESQSDLDGLCTVVEGASHAVCLLWHAHHERQVRPVDLELQAEIDKFMILTDGRSCTVERRDVHRRLFDNSQLIPAEGSVLHERYRTASKLASQYCHWLDARFIEDGDQASLHQELARFYRLSGRAKFDHIRRLH